MLIIAILLSGCGKKETKSNVTLQEMTKYEHMIHKADAPDNPGEGTLVRDADGYAVVSDTVYVLSNTLNIRMQPSSDAEVLTTVPYGTALTRSGIGDKGWDRVYYENTTAYVSSDHITELTIGENRTFDFSNAMLTVVDTSRQMYSYDSMCEDLTELRERYGAHMKLNSIGTTKDKRNVFEIVIGDPEKAKKHIYFLGGMCGAEYMSTLLCMRQAEYLLLYYESGNYNGFAYRELCDRALVHIIPMVNPDGVTISQEYLSCVRDPGIVADLRKWADRDKIKGGASLSLENYLMFFYANAGGVDLRYNFNYRWGESNTGVTEPGSAGYPGGEAESEPETKALLRQFAKDEPSLVVVYHTTGAKITYNYGQSEPLLSKAKKSAEAAAGVMNYEVSKDNAGISAYGSCEGYLAQELGVRTLGIALGNGSTPLSLNEFNAIWNACRTSWAVLQLSVLNDR